MEWAAPPPRALTLTLSRRAGEGMMVVDEGVGMVSVWLACHTSPGHTPLAALAPLSPGERGGWWFGWQARRRPGYSPRRAPRLFAPLARRKGRGCCWFSASGGNGCVGCLVGRAVLKLGPTSGGRGEFVVRRRLNDCPMQMIFTRSSCFLQMMFNIEL